MRGAISIRYITGAGYAGRLNLALYCMRYLALTFLRAGAFRYCKIDRFFFREAAPRVRGAQHRLAGPAILGTEILYTDSALGTDDQRVVGMPSPIL